MSSQTVFLTGGTGYLGRRLIPLLIEKGNTVRALARFGSAQKLPNHCVPIIGDALRSETYADRVKGASTFVHLVGVSHPSPSKAGQFRSVDFASVQAAVSAAVAAAIEHFVYVSVARPAPIMKAYVEIRAECESLICSSGLNATILRPWYVIGPGHRWPLALVPLYWLFERIPATTSTANRLGLVTIFQMIKALAWSVENPRKGIRVLDVQAIKNMKT